MQHVVVGVRRGKLVVTCGQARTTPVEERLGGGQKPYTPEFAKLTITAGGDEKEPVWLIEAESAPIGVLRIAEGICRLLDIVPGNVIAADFRAYTKDLESGPPDEALDEASTSPAAEHPSYSFAQPDSQLVEARAKNAILAHMAKLKLPGEDGWVILCRDELRFDDMSETDGHG